MCLKSAEGPDADECEEDLMHKVFHKQKLIKNDAGCKKIRKKQKIFSSFAHLHLKFHILCITFFLRTLCKQF